MVAHRGFWRTAPENSIASVLAALQHPVDGVEIDVHLTADGVPVVMHDGVVDRTTGGRGAISAMSLEELRSLRLRLPNGDGLSGEKVPTLDEILDLTTGKRLLCVEVKPAGIEREVLACFRRHEAEDWVWMWSFRRSVVMAFRELAPAIPSAFLSAGFYEWSAERFLDEAVKAGARSVSLFPEDVSPEVVEMSHRLGLEVYTGTPNEAEEWERLRDAGLEAVVTDDPPSLLARWGA